MLMVTPNTSDRNRDFTPISRAASTWRATPAKPSCRLQHLHPTCKGTCFKSLVPTLQHFHRKHSFVFKRFILKMHLFISRHRFIFQFMSAKLKKKKRNKKTKHKTNKEKGAHLTWKPKNRSVYHK